MWTIGIQMAWSHQPKRFAGKIMCFNYFVIEDLHTMLNAINKWGAHNTLQYPLSLQFLFPYLWTSIYTANRHSPKQQCGIQSWYLSSFTVPNVNVLKNNSSIDKSLWTSSRTRFRDPAERTIHRLFIKRFGKQACLQRSRKFHNSLSISTPYG